MRRRGWTVLVGAVLVAALTWVSLVIPVPYVALGPGPTVDTLGSNNGHQVITVQKGTASKPNGQLRLVTVSVTTDLDLGSAVYYWLSDDYAVVPRDAVYPPNQTDKQTDQQQQQQFQDSQSSAETAAYRALGCPVQVDVKSVRSGVPASGKLLAGDIVTSVDGKPVLSRGDLVRLVQAKPAGTTRTVGYLRNGQAGSVQVKTASGDGGGAVLGVTVAQQQPCQYQVKVDLGDIGGPSAGLMFALGIVDTLNPADITGGRVIAGTGEIDDDGNVKPIGGIQQKLIAAKRDGAQYFLTPKDNCSDAKASAPAGLPLVKVGTLTDAMNALADLRAHRNPPTC